MDVDDNDKYTNAMQLLRTLRLLWLSQQRARYCLLRDINIHKLHPLPEKNRLGLFRFSAQWNRGYTEIAVFVLWLIFCRFQSEFFRMITALSEIFSRDFNHDFLHSGAPPLRHVERKRPAATYGVVVGGVQFSFVCFHSTLSLWNRHHIIINVIITSSYLVSLAAAVSYPNAVLCRA